MSVRSTIMPPKSVNSGIGGRIVAIRAELTSVEGDRLQRPSAHRRAFGFLLVIGMGRIRAKFDVGLGFQRRDGVGAGAQKRFAQAR